MTRTFGSELFAAMDKMKSDNVKAQVECPTHGKTTGVRPPGFTTYRCETCLDIEISHRAKSAIESGEATALPGWDEEE